MTAFPTALKVWFDQHSALSLRNVADEAHLTPTDLSRVRSGHKPITFDALSKLLPAIERLSERRDACNLLVAYLEDETPPDYQAAIRLYAIDEANGTVEKDIITIAAERWTKRARTDAEFAAMWLTLDGYMHEANAAAVDAKIEAELEKRNDPEVTYLLTTDPAPNLRAAEDPPAQSA